MPPLTKKIIWKKFIDPFEPDKDRGKNNIGGNPDDDDDSHETPWEKLEKGKYEDDDDMGNFNKPFKVLHTPAGIFPVNEDSFPGRQFNLWVGHTNFRITHEVADILNDKVDGVEVLKVTTPYRFLLGVGLAFNEQVVKDDIEHNICYTGDIKPANVKNMFDYISGNNDEIPHDTINKVNNLLATLSKDQYIAVYVLPNLQLKIVKSDILDSSFINSIEELYLLKQSVGGAIFTQTPDTKPIESA